MLTLKRKKLVFTLLLGLVGLGYFSTMSNLESSLEIAPFLKSSVALLPIQVGVLIYLLGFRRSSE